MVNSMLDVLTLMVLLFLCIVFALGITFLICLLIHLIREAWGGNLFRNDEIEDAHE